MSDPRTEGQELGEELYERHGDGIDQLGPVRTALAVVVGGVIGLAAVLWAEGGESGDEP